MYEFQIAKMKKSKVAKETWQEEYDHLYEQLAGFIDRGEFAQHGMMIGRTSDGGIELNVMDINPANHRDELIFEIRIARDGVKDNWTLRQYVDNRAGFIVTIYRDHPSRGKIVLEQQMRVDGGFRSLTAFIRRYVRNYEEEIKTEFGGFSVQDDFEDYSYYASADKRD